MRILHHPNHPIYTLEIQRVPYLSSFLSAANLHGNIGNPYLHGQRISLQLTGLCSLTQALYTDTSRTWEVEKVPCLVSFGFGSFGSVNIDQTKLRGEIGSLVGVEVGESTQTISTFAHSHNTWIFTAEVLRGKLAIWQLEPQFGGELRHWSHIDIRCSPSYLDHLPWMFWGNNSSELMGCVKGIFQPERILDPFQGTLQDLEPFLRLVGLLEQKPSMTFHNQGTPQWLQLMQLWSHSAESPAAAEWRIPCSNAAKT